MLESERVSESVSERSYGFPEIDTHSQRQVPIHFGALV
jgi:hypothetical protein